MGTCASKDKLALAYLCNPGIIWHPDLGRESTKEAQTKAADEKLASFSGRTCSNGASNVSSLYTQQGRKAVNQDAMLVWENFGSVEDTVFCGVFDGHGPYGHLVAKEIRDSLPPKLFSQWHAARSIIKQDEITLLSADLKDGRRNIPETYDMYNSFKSSESGSTVGAIANSPNVQECSYTSQHADVFSSWKEALLKAFKVMDKELKIHLTLDCFCSGSTAVTLVKQGQDLIIANVGDSRAIMAARGDDDTLVAVQLTEDLKPNLPEEEERIRQCRGRVFALKNEPERYRVWLPCDDSPGLAMARSFGDFCLKDYGVISVPKITCRRVTDKDVFIVLATDGVWDVLSNQEAVDTIASVSTRAVSAKTLVDAAIRAWKIKRPSRKMDDCAVICLYLDASFCK